MEQPTMRMIARHFGSRDVVVAQVAVVVTQAMELFAPNRRLSPAMVSMWSEDLLADYPHESIADVNVFLLNAARGKYDEGEFFASVDIPRLNKWWTKYLDEKAIQREIDANRHDDLQGQNAAAIIGAIPGLSQAVAEFSAGQREAVERMREHTVFTTLERQLPGMTTDELRTAWKLYPGAKMRSIIQAEACRRGLMGEELRQAQIQQDAKA